MKNILLINEGNIPHYRVPVYNYLSEYLCAYQLTLSVVSAGVEEGNPYTISFSHRELHLGFTNLKKLFIKTRPQVVIFWVSPHFYMVPILFILKLLRIKIIHWGHRRPMHSNILLKEIVYNFEHWVDDAVILYSESLRKYIYNRFQHKTFIANNTLNLTTYQPCHLSKEEVKTKYGIFTSKNIICLGRIQRRKRINDLVQAFRMLDIEDAGLILAGPDSDGILKNIEGSRIFKVGPVYGEESLNLLSASDVYCLPGAIGLGIVDAFYCGLPVVTENVIHGPEIMYLKDGINGFIVPKGDITQLAAKLKTLLIDDTLREKFSQAARDEIMTNGHIDRMCEGFRDALRFVCK